MLEGKTKTGFEFELDEDVLDDAELLDELVELDNGDPRHQGNVIIKLLGKDQKKRLYDHVRNDKGRVPYEKLTPEIMDIFTAAKDGKN